MGIFWKSCLLLIAAVVLGCGPAAAEKRVALVIGNGAYAHKAELTNPQHDAEDVAAALERSDFEVILATNLGQAEMQDALIRFSRAARNADVAMFYYSGHAMQFNGVNYLMPIDAKLDDEADLKRFARVDDIMNDLQQAKNLRILVLDSCRDNPFAESLKRSSARGLSIRQGLSKVDAPLGTIVSFSTQAGQTADDGNGRNSPYSSAFVKHIEEPKEIGEVFREISADVYETSGRVQLPELSLSIVGKFYLNGPVSITVTAPAAAAGDPCSSAETHWKAAESVGTVAAFEDHIARFPACTFAVLARARIDGLKQKAALASPDDGPSSPRTGAGKFDGEWHVNISCPPAGKAGAYARYVLATVKNGELQAELLKPGTPTWLNLSGKIGADGKATLFARGLTGDPGNTLNNAKPGSPYSFTVNAQFDGSSGTGKRNELRPCDLNFARR
jgi:hypothetical protein